MRILVVVLVVLVFGAMLLFDTAALLRLAGLCLTGGCGIPFLWVASVAGTGAAALAILAWLRRRRRGRRRGGRAGRKPATRPPRGGKGRPARRKGAK